MLYDSLNLCRFVGIDLGRETVPEATTLLKFRHLLEEHKLRERIFAEVGVVLQARGAKVQSGPIVHEERGEGASPRNASDTQRSAKKCANRKLLEIGFPLLLWIDASRPKKSFVFKPLPLSSGQLRTVGYHGFQDLL